MARPATDGDTAATLTTRAGAAPYVTRDGSIIRELMHPAVHGNRNQSLAEAEVPPGCVTLLHRHPRSEELYHVTAGQGLMTLGEATFAVGPGDTVHIAPGTPHRIANTGDAPLLVLCCCAPPYGHDDTDLLDPAG
jgi:mannose-6-phosphate isomerase-like protein (cupin superfamily)